MNLAIKIIVSQIDSLLEEAKNFPSAYNDCDKKLTGDLYNDLQYFSTRVKYLFKNIPKIDHSFIERIEGFSFGHLSFNKHSYRPFEEELIAVTSCLLTLKLELENNLLFNVSDLIKAEVFESHLESAKHLLDKGFKDAAAVIIGGVLEDKLRQLSVKNDTPLKDDKGKYLTINPMNDNLYKKGVYNLSIQKQIIALAEIRNNAAHGKYDEYTNEQVKKFYRDVLDFNP